MPSIKGIPVSPSEYQRFHFVLTNEEQATMARFDKEMDKYAND